MKLLPWHVLGSIRCSRWLTLETWQIWPMDPIIMIIIKKNFNSLWSTIIKRSLFLETFHKSREKSQIRSFRLLDNLHMYEFNNWYFNLVLTQRSGQFVGQTNNIVLTYGYNFYAEYVFVIVCITVGIMRN